MRENCINRFFLHSFYPIFYKIRQSQKFIPPQPTERKKPRQYPREKGGIFGYCVLVLNSYRVPFIREKKKIGQLKFLQMKHIFISGGPQKWYIPSTGWSEMRRDLSLFLLKYSLVYAILKAYGQEEQLALNGRHQPTS